MTRPRLPPLAAPLLVGFSLRLIAALAGHGWFAVDDYEFGVEQAAAWLTDPDAGFACPYRSPLMSRLFWLLLEAVHRTGVDDPARLLQGAYAGLGVISLAAIPGVYELAKSQSPRNAFSDRAALSAAWLMAAFAPMPRISTRALIEVIAIVPLVWGAVALQASVRGATARRVGLGAAAGLLFGVATLLRFQIGVLFPAALGWLIWRGRRDTRGFLATAMGLTAGGTLAACLQGCIDLSLGRDFLSTPWAYVSYNLHHADSFGTSPWYTFLLHFVMYTVPPVTVVLALPLGRALRRHALVAVLLGVFVAAHSLIGHKEDRFMFPALPLFFVPLGAALADIATGDRWQRWGFRVFWGVNIAGALLAVFSDAHRNLTVPLLQLARTHTDHEVLCVGFGNLPRYYGGPRVRYELVSDIDGVERAIAGGSRPDHVWFRSVPSPDIVARLRHLPGLRCEMPVPYPGDFMDRVLVSVNRHNARRAPTAMARCGGAPTARIE